MRAPTGASTVARCWPLRGVIISSAAWCGSARRLVWICPPTEMEICRRASKDQHTVHLREFTDTYVQVELHHRAGAVAREIQASLIDCGQAAGVHPIDLLIAATALGYGFTVLTDDGDYAYQIAAVRPDLSGRMVGDGPD